MAQTIVEINLTTNGYSESGGVATIIIDEDKADMVNGQSLFRTAPNGSHFIVRNPQGKYLVRHGETKSDQPGISLTSYLFGMSHMRRVNIKNTEDYSSEAYKPNTGRPAAIDVMNSEHSHRPIEIMYENEYLNWKKVDDEKKRIAIQQKEVAMSDELIQERINALNVELSDIQSRINTTRAIAAGKKAPCACCGNTFTKAKSISIYCSSRRQDGKNGCKDTLNARKTYIRNLIKQLGGEPSIVSSHINPTQSQLAEPATENLPAVIETFKTIGGIPFTLAETKALLSSNKEQDNFKEYRGITFSLTEMKKLVLE